MSKYCNFLPTDQSSLPRWRCSACGFQTHKGLQVAPSRVCKTPIKLPDVLASWLYLKCPRRGNVIATTDGIRAGCGCGGTTVEIYECRYFHEPVLKQAAARCLEKIQATAPGYTGRTCRECKVPMQAATEPIRETKQASYRLPEIRITQSLERGIVTGASQVHWPCLGALAISASQQGIGFAVADHGLRPWQREELDKAGVRWINHEKPGLSTVKQKHYIQSDIKAWWKPWVCLASPFERSVWVDSDAVVTGDIGELFAAPNPLVSTERIWQPDGAKLYRELVGRLFGEIPAETLHTLSEINSGVLAWQRGESLFIEWRDWCLRLMNDGDLVPMCRVRDQAGLLVTLVDRSMSGRPMPTFLEDRWNMPADGLIARQSKGRRKIRLDPAGLLADATARHPGAAIVHWLGGIKPWNIN